MAIISLINITVTVATGTSNHGNPKLLCLQGKWYDEVVCFALNYFSHAATVKSLPGEQLSDTVLDILSALLYPFSGIHRGIERMFRRAAWFSESDLESVARAGALCIVVRTRS